MEVDPAKRLTQEELKVFLFKHRENITNHNSLHIDNVPKKLHLSVNDMLRTIAFARMSGQPGQGGTGRPSQQYIESTLKIDPSQGNFAELIKQHMKNEGVVNQQAANRVTSP